MLVLAPKLHEEMVFKNGDFEIRLKFYLNNNNHVRVAITAPRSISVSREKIKKPTETRTLYEHHISDDQESLWFTSMK